jgi:hypothetical protein
MLRARFGIGAWPQGGPPGKWCTCSAKRIIDPKHCLEMPASVSIRRASVLSMLPACLFHRSRSSWIRRPETPDKVAGMDMSDSEYDVRHVNLGQIVMVFGALEERAQLLLAGFVHDQLVGWVMAADINFSSVITKLRALSTIPSLGDVGARLHEWSTEALAVGEQRNAVIHGTWRLLDPERPTEGMRSKLTAKGRIGRLGDVYRRTPESDEDLESLLQDTFRLVVEAGLLSHQLSSTGKWTGIILEESSP